jgi:magnesium-transporting ATPase (P-type)
MAVLISATVTAVNDYQKERQFMKLNSEADSRKRVNLRRKGELLELHQDDLLIGDIVQLSEGMEIPADGYLLESNEITTDESAMTGETEPIKKNLYERCVSKAEEIVGNGEKNTAGKYDVPSPILMSGTRILTGEGKMLVIVVGDLSCIGKIRALLTNEEPKATPLQMKL